jgi:hypothetical protein
MPQPIRDPVLGLVSWDEKDRWWRFDAGPINGRSIGAIAIPEPNWNPVAEESLSSMRACAQWIRTNEPAIRTHIAREMFDWWLDSYYDEDIDEITTPEGFRDTIELAGISFYGNGKAYVLYDDHNLVGGHTISLSVSPSGEFSDGPDITG